jgi:hypothetical protein
MSKILIAKDAAEKAFSAELSRTESQSRNAWKLAAGILVVMAFQLREVKSMVESPSHWVKILCGVSLAILAVALILAFQGLQTRGNANYPRGNKLWENLKPENISPEAAEEALVQMLLQTREQNARLNDARSRILAWCGWLFCAGSLVVVSSQLLEAISDWT